MTLQQQLQHALSALKPTHCQLDNESRNHAGYFAGKESHFRLVIVSDAFIGQRLLARHQTIYTLVDDFFIKNGGSLHALAIFAYTPEEWRQQQHAPQSPLCASRRSAP